jgi:hypothetical protein
MKTKRSILLIVAAVFCCALGIGLIRHHQKPSAMRNVDSPIDSSVSASANRRPQRKMSPNTFAGLPENARDEMYAERIHGLGRGVALEEQKRLLQWINGPMPAHLSNGSWHWLVNDVMDALCHQKDPLAELSDAFVAMCRDSKNHPVLRDYAIQHLVDWLEPVNLGEPFEKDPQKRQLIVSAIMEAARESSQAFSGTALQALHMVLLRQERPSFDAEGLPLPLKPERLQPLVVEAAALTALNLPSRITALQICAERGFKDSLPNARKVAADSAQPISLRLSSIALIGMIGTAEDASLLERLRDEAHPRMIKAIAPALEKISRRIPAAASASINSAQLSFPSNP